MSLTNESGIQMQDELIKGYVTKDFQEKIWAAFSKDGGDPLAWAKARQAITAEIQYPVIEKYGFEGSRAGVSESTKAFTDAMNAYPPIAWRNNFMFYLIDPAQQQQVSTGKLAKPLGVFPSRWNRPEPNEWLESSAGKVWRVVGGGDKGGIIVRATKDSKSAQMDKRLSTGAIIEECDRDEDRLKYEIIDGNGPAIGWISMSFKNKPLIEPLWFDPEAGDVVDSVSFKVVHEKVAKREGPSKDAKILGMAKKGDIVKGTVVEVDGVEWLTVKTAGLDAGKDVEAFMMLDGKSVGLGQLLEKQ